MSHRYSGLNGEAFCSNISGRSDRLPVPPQDVCGFLPELTIELATAQTTQDEEVEKKLQHLNQLKEQLKKENERLKLVVACVCTANRAITVSQDRVAHSSLKCQRLAKTISRAVAEKEDLSRQLREVSKEKEREEKLREEYREKMRIYEECVTQVEEDSPANRELANLITEKQELESKRALYMHGEGLEVLSGERQKRLQETIIATETGCVVLDEEEDEIQEKTRLCQQQVHKWRSQVDMNRKRHQAQVIRLQRLLLEAQARRRQWSQQNDTLHNTISTLQMKLNNIISR